MIRQIEWGAQNGPIAKNILFEVAFSLWVYLNYLNMTTIGLAEGDWLSKSCDAKIMIGNCKAFKKPRGLSFNMLLVSSNLT